MRSHAATGGLTTSALLLALGQLLMPLPLCLFGYLIRCSACVVPAFFQFPPPELPRAATSMVKSYSMVGTTAPMNLRKMNMYCWIWGSDPPVSHSRLRDPSMCAFRGRTATVIHTKLVNRSGTLRFVRFLSARQTQADAPSTFWFVPSAIVRYFSQRRVARSLTRSLARSLACSLA